MSFEVFNEKSSYLKNARNQFEDKNKVLESIVFVLILVLPSLLGYYEKSNK